MFKNTLELLSLTDLNLNNKHKKVILCLENNFFISLKIKIENPLNDEDRKEKIEDKLEIMYPKYNDEDYILNYEIISKDKKSETFIVYLLDLLHLNDNIIIDDMKDYGLISIIPSFFTCREKNIENEYINIDIGEELIIISEYENKKIKDISSFKISNSITNNDFEETISYENSYEIINTYLYNILNDKKIIFTGNEIDFNNLDLENKNYEFYKPQKISYKNYLNFLPNELKKRYFLYYVNSIYLYTFLALSILTLIGTIGLHFFIQQYENSINEINTSNEEIQESIDNMRNEMKEIENNIETYKNTNKEKENSSFKIGNFLENLVNLCPNGIEIKSIEFDDKKILNIEGFSQSVNQVIEFLENLYRSENFEVVNYDYIQKNENSIEFKLEIKFVKK